MRNQDSIRGRGNKKFGNGKFTSQDFLLCMGEEKEKRKRERNEW
jgi:hypothetical protein